MNTHENPSQNVNAYIALVIIAVLVGIITHMALEDLSAEQESCDAVLKVHIKNDDCVKVQEHLKRGWLLQVKDGYVELTHPAGVMQGLLRIYNDDKVKK